MDGSRFEKPYSSFNTLAYQKRSKFPSKDASTLPHLHELVWPHIGSFNSILDGGLLDLTVQNLEKREIVDASGNRLCFWLEDVQVGKALLPDKEHYSLNRNILPRECRERGVTYRGKMTGVLAWSVNGGPVQKEVRSLGQLPLMVRSSRCHLADLSPAELVAKREDSEELGGYFIVNGLEKLIRLLIVPRRNVPLALIRSSFAKRGPTYTQFGVQMRSVRDDQSAQTIYLHYCSDGSVMVRFMWRKNEYLVPLMLILRALGDEVTDRAVMEAMLQGESDNTFVSGRVEAMLRDFRRFNLLTREQCRTYLGQRFAIVLGGGGAELSPAEAGRELLKRIILVHLQDDRDKFNLLILMVRKLLALVEHRCCPDNADAASHQEVLLPGHLVLMILREKMDDWLSNIRLAIASDLRKGLAVNFDANGAYLKRVLTRCPSDLGRKIEYFLATGNLVSNTGLDLQQMTGYTIVAEKLNWWRYLAHFRSIHRGAFFAELKTTTVRKLMPESWGFLCPVHTPDGAPCGLLNHLSHTCQVSLTPVDNSALLSLLPSLGMLPMEHPRRQPMVGAAPVLLDGRWVGVIPPTEIETLGRTLRHLKASQHPALPRMLEIAAIVPSKGGLWPGLFLFTTPARLMRPIVYRGLAEKKDCELMVGTMEQLYLDIAVRPEEMEDGGLEGRLLVEQHPTAILSLVANLGPFPDHNQSPRNMYQCQMGKQSMGTPAHNLDHRCDNKLYRLLTGQSPIVRTRNFEHYAMDDYPNGVNAVVAVISYTGYDMEDAMVINKMAYERGLGHATVYKSDFYDCSERNVKGEPPSHHFGTSTFKVGPGKTIDVDGLPAVGQRVKPDDPLFSIIDEATGKVTVERYKAFEEAYIEQVRLLGEESGEGRLDHIHIKFRIPRNPVIGDKFSSRHGQKGVCSQHYPLVDLPWTEGGFAPDIIINPHAFPSRMTIGMFVESMAAKSGACLGIAQDATPFRYSEQQPAAHYFGEQLVKCGYNYYGNEPMYSGITGELMMADIYIGVVFYQRLRHMVSDKFQVRTIGPVHNLTQQPVKGRKRAGGIRFGEMERDSLLAHGVSFLLQDRLMNCSDYSQSPVCRRCGSILSPIATPSSLADPRARRVHCRVCERDDTIDMVAIPFVFRYLAAELMAMNIGVRLQVES